MGNLKINEIQEIVENKCWMATIGSDFETKSRMLVEESSEYTQAWCKLKRDDAPPDVLCVALQLANMVGKEKVYREMNKKLDRYFEREAKRNPNRVVIEKDDIGALTAEEEDFNAQMF